MSVRSLLNLNKGNNNAFRELKSYFYKSLTESTSLFDTTASLDTYNRFDSLSSLSEPDSPVPDNIGPPKAASSPIVQQQREVKSRTTKSVLNHPLRILVMNCQSIKNKRAELHTIIDSAKPDIILGNESWLTPDIQNSEIFPDSFDAIRKDRVGDAHGSGTFRPKSISSPRRFAPRTFRPWSFRPWTFRPYWTFRPLDVSPPNINGGGGGGINVEIFVRYILNYTLLGQH